MNFIIPTGLALFWASTVCSYGVPCPNQYGKVQCSYSYDCIPRTWECDGIKDDCPGNTDEKGCPECLGIYCDGNETFIPWIRVCDFLYDCNDLSDEDASKYGCDCRELKCSTGYCLPNEGVCDNIIDCWPTVEDEIGCPCDGPEVFQCGADGPCLNRFYKCDGFNHCPNGEDEQNCSCIFQCADGSCLKQDWQLCDRYNHCPNGDDELDCPCNLTQFPCETLDNICVPWDLVCDCVPDCADGSDEINCVLGTILRPPQPPRPPPGHIPGGPSGPGGPMLLTRPTSTNPKLEKIISERVGALKRGP